MTISRRGLITGLISLVAAPAIVRVDSLMKLPAPKVIKHDLYTINEFINQIMEPIIKKYETALANAVLYGESTTLHVGDKVFVVEPYNLQFNSGGLSGLLNDPS